MSAPPPIGPPTPVGPTNFGFFGIATDLLPPRPYIAEELERDNPHNAWMTEK